MTDLFEQMIPTYVTVQEFSRALDRLDALETALSLADDPEAVERAAIVLFDADTGNGHGWKSQNFDTKGWYKNIAATALRAAEKV